MTEIKNILNKDTAIPLHFQIKEFILEKIKNKEYKEGQFIPTEKEFIELFEVSRITVRKSLNDLEAQGTIKKIRGRGTIVCKKRPIVSLTENLGLYAYLKEKNIGVDNIILGMSEKKPNESVKKKLEITGDEKILEIRRLRKINGELVNYSIIHVNKYFFPTLLNEDLKNRSLHEIFKETFNISIDKVKNIGYSIIPDSDLLKIFNSDSLIPIQVFENIGFKSDDIPVEYSINYFRSDRVLFEFTVERNETAKVTYINNKLKK